MRRGVSALLAIFAVAASWVTAAQSAPTPWVWPHQARAAVSLAYDDALNSQLDFAVPALNRHGLKASFYLTLSSDTVRTRLAAWRTVAAQGHELGNHTLFHQLVVAGLTFIRMRPLLSIGACVDECCTSAGGKS